MIQKQAVLGALQRLSEIVNHFDADTPEDYWVSGPERDGSNKLYGSRSPVEIDEDVREEYGRVIWGRPDRASDKKE